MRKSVTFISAALTAFVLAMLAGVVYAYNNGLTVSGLFSQQASTQSAAVSLPLMAPTAASSAVAPKDAAAAAAQFLNRTDLYSIQLATYNGTQAYEVTFSSGEIAYVSMNGQVMGVAAPTQAPVVIYAPAKRGGGGGAPAAAPPKGGGGTGSGGGGDDGGGGDH